MEEEKIETGVESEVTGTDVAPEMSEVTSSEDVVAE